MEFSKNRKIKALVIFLMRTEGMTQVMRVFKNVLKLIKWLIGGVEVQFLVLCVGQNCSLKCRDCSNLAPYAPKDMLIYDCESIIADLETFTSKIMSIELLQIQGGEPFLYKDIDKIITYAGQNRKIKHIRITTNSTIIPRQQTMNLLRQYDVSITLSDYPVTASKRKILEQRLKEEKIRYEVYEFLGGRGGGLWRNMGYMVPREADNEIVRKRFLSCAFSGCTTLENGVIGHCSRSTNAPYVQNYVPARGELLEIRKNHLKIRFLWWYIFQLKMFKGKCMECCRRCLGSSGGEEIEPAIQLIGTGKGK